MADEPHLPFVAILRGITPDEVLVHASVLSAHGFEAVEVPTNSPRWSESVRRLAADYGDALEVGAGTVLSVEAVDELATTGATLMVTPNTDATVIRRAKDKGLRVMAGAMTPTEVLAAVSAGADAVKVFPAGIVGPGFARAVAAVLPRPVPLYAVGGIKVTNLAEWAAPGSGWAGFGLGTELYRPGQPVNDTEARAAAFRRAWEELKK